MLSLAPITLADAKKFITANHRHHVPSAKWKFGVGVTYTGLDPINVTLKQYDHELIGVIVVGRPVNRNLDDGYTLEVTRCATWEIKNANSILYGAARRASKALGYRRLITYILESESGISLKASGFHFVDKIKGKTWNTPSRPRSGDYLIVDKQRWEMDL